MLLEPCGNSPLPAETLTGYDWDPSEFAMTGRLRLILAALMLALAPGCFSVQAPLPTPAPVPAPRLPPTQPGFHDAGYAVQSDLGAENALIVWDMEKA